MHKKFNPHEHLAIGGTVNYIEKMRPSWKLFINRPKKKRGVGFTRRDKEETKTVRNMRSESRRRNR